MWGNIFFVVVVNCYYEEFFNLGEIELIYFFEKCYVVGILDGLVYYCFFELLDFV